MTKKGLCVLVLITALAACKSEAANDDTAPEEDSVSGNEMPAGQPLALDSSHNVRVVEHGLQFDAGYYYVRDSVMQKWVPSTHRFGMDDTAFFTPVIKGYGVADGKVSIALSRLIIRDANEKVIHEGGGNKHVSRFAESEATYATFYMPVAWLDSLAGSHTVPHYDVEYTLSDRITGKSIDGIFRIYVARE